MEKIKTKTKRSFNKLLIILIIIIILALVLSYFFKFPFNFGNENSSNNESNNNTTTVTNTSENNAKENSDILTITVQAEKILLQEEEINLETLKAKLNEASENVVIQLIDDGATLGTYEEVEKVLESSNLPFTKVDNIKQ